MSRFVFGSEELAPLLRQQGWRFTTGYLHIHLKGLDPSEGAEPWVLTYYHGRLLFSADQPLNTQILLKRLSRFIPRLNLEWPQRAISVVQERLMKDHSLPELLEAITQLGLLKPGELEDALWLNLLTDFDRYLFERAGTCYFEVQEQVAQEAPIGGFELEPLLQEAARRHDRWADLKVAIPTLLAVPVVNWERVNRYRITDEQRQKLHTLTKDGQSLEAIAKKLCRDRLEVANLFASWAKKRFGQPTNTPRAAADQAPQPDNHLGGGRQRGDAGNPTAVFAQLSGDYNGQPRRGASFVVSASAPPVVDGYRHAGDRWSRALPHCAQLRRV